MDTIYIYMGIFIIICVCVYLIYYYLLLPYQLNTNKYAITLLTPETEFTENYINTIQIASLITRNTLYVPKLGYGLTFAWEMYIPSQGGNDKWQNSYNHLKPIISMMDSPVISYHPKKNYLSIILKYRNNPFYAQFSELKYNNIKPQKWSKYILVIKDRDIRLYIDGVLELNKHLPNIAVIYDSNSDIILGEINNNFLGSIKNLVLYPFPVEHNNIANL